MTFIRSAGRWRSRYRILPNAAIWLTCFAAGLPSPALAASATTIGDDADNAPLSPAMRIATIGYRLATANYARCPRRSMLTGLLLHDRAAYDEKVRTQFTELGWGFGVLGAVSGSPARKSGLRQGDEIVALDELDLRDFRRDVASRTGTYERLEAFTALLAATLTVRPARLMVIRDGVEREITLAQQAGCSVAFTLAPGQSPDAWTDGFYLAVTEGLADLVGDDALAFSMAHELAHIALNHDRDRERPLAALGIGAGPVRRQEVDADRLAVSLVNAAGYDPNGGLALFDALRKLSSFRFGFTHPSNSARIALVKDEIGRLAGSGSLAPNASPPLNPRHK